MGSTARELQEYLLEENDKVSSTPELHLAVVWDRGLIVRAVAEILRDERKDDIIRRRNATNARSGQHRLVRNTHESWLGHLC